MMFGNAFYAGCQWLVLIIIARIGGAEDVGTFTLALALTTPIMSFCALGMRTILASDVGHDRTLGAYLSAKVAITTLGLLVCIGVAAWYGTPSCWTIVAIAVAKTIESFSDMCYGYAQQAQNMNRIATSLIMRGTLSTAFLALIYAATDSLAVSACAYAASWLLILVLYDRHSVMETLQAIDKKTVTAAKSVLIIGIPLGISALMTNLGINIPRYFLENNFGAKELGIFSSMAYFITVGNVPVMALGNALVPVLAIHHMKGDTRRFNGMILKAIFGVCILGLCGIAASFFLGHYVLNLVYGPAFAERADILPLIAIAAAIGYVGNILGYAISSAKIFIAQAPAQILVSVISLSGSFFLIPSLGLTGAAYVLILNAVAQCIFILPLFLLKKRRN
jgi:O-antigen/teichoic acid export membrane protein